MADATRELELKLTLLPNAQAAQTDWLLRQTGVKDLGERHLVNVYFDTPTLALNQQRIALRVRQVGERFIQTLKTKGAFVDGAHQRQEWEWPMTSAGLDLSLLADTPLGGSAFLAALEPVFETNFTRRVLLLQEGDSIIECALDRGEIIAGANRMPLCELELELKAGDPGAIQAWGRRLAEQAPVLVNLISKAEQGYFLAGHYQPRPQPAEGPLLALFRAASAWWLTGDAVWCERLQAALGSLRERSGEGFAMLGAVIQRIAEAGEPEAGLLATPEFGQLQLAMLAAEKSE
ncbi:MAG: CYTH domain-containing protein [Marinobacter sp.]|nr:CYTH domain-containing protein [Marinobacter sp.]